LNDKSAKQKIQDENDEILKAEGIRISAFDPKPEKSQDKKVDVKEVQAKNMRIKEIQRLKKPPSAIMPIPIQKQKSANKIPCLFEKLEEVDKEDRLKEKLIEAGKSKKRVSANPASVPSNAKVMTQINPLQLNPVKSNENETQAKPTQPKPQKSASSTQEQEEIKKRNAQAQIQIQATLAEDKPIPSIPKKAFEHKATASNLSLQKAKSQSPTDSTSMRSIAERMKRDPEFFQTTMQELKVKNLQLYNFIKTSPDKFYKLAEDGKLDTLAQKKSQDEQAIKKVRFVKQNHNS